MGGKCWSTKPSPVDTIEDKGTSQSSPLQDTNNRPKTSTKRLPRSPFPVELVDAEDQLISIPTEVDIADVDQEYESESSSQVSDEISNENVDDEAGEENDDEADEDADDSDANSSVVYNAAGYPTMAYKGAKMLAEYKRRLAQQAATEKMSHDDGTDSEDDTNEYEEEDEEETSEIAATRLTIPSSSGITTASFMPAQRQSAATLPGPSVKKYLIKEIPMGGSLSKQTLASKYNKGSQLAFIEKHCPPAEAHAAKTLVGDALREKLLEVRDRVLYQQPKTTTVQPGKKKRARDDSEDEDDDVADPTKHVSKKLKTSKVADESNQDSNKIKAYTEGEDVIMTGEEQQEENTSGQDNGTTSHARDIRPGSKTLPKVANGVDSTIVKKLSVDLMKTKAHILKELEQENTGSSSTGQDRADHTDADIDTEFKEIEENEDNSDDEESSGSTDFVFSILMVDNGNARVSFEAQVLIRSILRELLSMQELMDEQGEGEVSKDNQKAYNAAKKAYQKAYGKLMTIVKKKLGGSEEDARALTERYFGIRGGNVLEMNG